MSTVYMIPVLEFMDAHSLGTYAAWEGVTTVHVERVIDLGKYVNSVSRFSLTKLTKFSSEWKVG